MWHNHIQDKAKDPGRLSRIEKDNKNKDIDYVVQTMGKYMQREIDKRNNTDG